ncbi:RND family transporter [Tsukamurella sp. 8F]|uniref:MMPL/RND family transporter n=1 Tax=unclassified Tsukamurella TaxID=2633480 RepID=UPI0023B8936E|nr:MULTISPECIES: RND family transporter [unclassified Tsukamurella]MDF0530313.1 RND family transporter [Tsukamurella sp. 8J]MDF0587610.1 RND family transporter [Tsukamurella sp. 8F]
MKIFTRAALGTGRLSTRHPLLTIGAWLLLAAILNLAVPQIHVVAATRSADFIPRDAPAVQALTNMGVRFDESTSSGSSYVILHRDGKLTSADQQYYRQLLGRLGTDRDHVQSVQDLWGNPTTAPAALSPDKTTVYALIRLAGDTGTSKAVASVKAVRAAVSDLPRPPGLTALVAGPAATISDEFAGIEKSLPIVTLVTIVCIMMVLFVVYRSVIAVAIPLITIGLALAVANGTVSFLGLHGMPVSIFSVSLLSAIVLGAGTDYAIFLISRYHEARRAGIPAADALETGFTRIAPVIIASGLVVTLTCAAMVVTKIGLFRTVGLPCAIGVAVTLLAALTLTPAMMRLAARFGFLEPRARKSPLRYWHWIGVRTVRSPARVLAVAAGALVLLAAAVPTIHLSYDERAAQPKDTDSNRGDALIAAHYHGNVLLPQYVTITADHDLRNTKDYATLEAVADAVAKVPDVVAVQSVSRPLGKTIKESSLGYQAGVVADGLFGGVSELDKAQPRIKQLTDGTGRLAKGAGQLKSGSEQLSSGIKQAVSGSEQLVDGNRRLSAGLGQAKTGSAQLRNGADRLAAGANELSNGVQQYLGFLDAPQQFLSSLRAQVASTPNCASQPMCGAIANLLKFLDSTPAAQTLSQIDRLRTGVQQLSDGSRQLADGLQRLDTGLGQASDGADALLDGQTRLNTGLHQLDDGGNRLVGGSEALADGSQQVDGGVNQMTSQLSRMRTGLTTAGGYLDELRTNTSPGPSGGFYIPQFAMDRPDFQTAVKLFVSPDGKMARMIVTDQGDPFSTAAMERTGAILRAAQQAVRGTSLDRSAVDVTGLTPVYRDLRSMAMRDLVIIVVLASLLAFVIIAALVRSLVVPIYVVGSAILSFAAALGLSILLWQHILRQPLHWAVPSLSFIILVSVAADYNVLLMSRVRDEALRSRLGLRGSPRHAIIKAVTSTGGVITTAGAVFAITMLALTAASAGNTAQVGFTIGAGLIIDTMVVRTVVVPGIATLVGRWNWWPSGVAARRRRPRGT